jgi:membrane dipeptidase
MKKIIPPLILLFMLYWIGTMTVPAIIEKGNNPVKQKAPFEVSEKRWIYSIPWIL